MLNAIKARLRASVALHLDAKAWREAVSDFTRMLWRLVQPGTATARGLGCGCLHQRKLFDLCPFHGHAQREAIYGRR